MTKCAGFKISDGCRTRCTRVTKPGLKYCWQHSKSRSCARTNKRKTSAGDAAAKPRPLTAVVQKKPLAIATLRPVVQKRAQPPTVVNPTLARAIYRPDLSEKCPLIRCDFWEKFFSKYGLLGEMRGRGGAYEEYTAHLIAMGRPVPANIGAEACKAIENFMPALKWLKDCNQKLVLNGDISLGSYRDKEDGTIKTETAISFLRKIVDDTMWPANSLPNDILNRKFWDWTANSVPPPTNDFYVWRGFHVKDQAEAIRLISDIRARNGLFTHRPGSHIKPLSTSISFDHAKNFSLDEELTTVRLKAGESYPFVSIIMRIKIPKGIIGSVVPIVRTQQVLGELPPPGVTGEDEIFINPWMPIRVVDYAMKKFYGPFDPKDVNRRPCDVTEMLCLNCELSDR